MRRLSFVVCLVALTALACEDPTSQIPTSPGPPAVTGIELSGPSSIAPGQSAQLVVTIRLAGGIGKLPSPGTPLQWFSTNNAVLSVNAAGVASAGQQVGAAQIFVTYGTGSGQRQANKEFIVVPDGTYRLVGMIGEADFPTAPVIGATVSVSPGSLASVTGPDGRYQLYGVPAAAVVTITKAGYTTLSQNIQLTSHTTRNFSLVLSGTRFTIAGPYTLTLDLTGSCSGNSPLSASLQQRTYDAVITQNGPEVLVVLTEGRFRINSIGRGNKFTGRASADAVSFILDPFDLYYYYYNQLYYPSIAERLADNTILVPQGSVTASASGAGLSGTMQGAILRWDARFPLFNTTVLTYCNPAAIRFTLTPR